VCQSLIVFQCLYVVPFLRYSPSKNGMTLKLGVGVIQGHWKLHRLMDHIRLSVGLPLHSSMLYHFRVIWPWIILWPWNMGQRSLQVIQTGTIRKTGWSFLFAFHSNYGCIFNHLWDIQRQSIAWPSKLGRSRSLKMASFDRSYTTFYWSAIVNIALSCTVFWVIWRWIILWPWNLG